MNQEDWDADVVAIALRTGGMIPAALFMREMQRAIEAEREACAKVCEHNASLYIEYATGWESSMECAEDIRARGEK